MGKQRPNWYTGVFRALLKHGIEHGANVHSQADNGWTALHFAVDSDRADAACLLIQNGANVNAQNSVGQTALHIAVSRGYSRADCARVLLEHNANTDIRDDNGRTALEIAQDGAIPLENEQDTISYSDMEWRYRRRKIADLLIEHKKAMTEMTRASAPIKSSSRVMEHLPMKETGRRLLRLRELT
ncbi:ankyrin repeat-containing domain protein [Vararia minispora EC-137]|uniref:Ankyrin repeat-containing domain protein n=1 Tax=Vararia minispora EC-137 TaxID=1314806 RepID=A0ACB8Q4H6_9AGAM|nr:ankyrin repeat-containing domain protein [Vararia minispora EC-137]